MPRLSDTTIRRATEAANILDIVGDFVELTKKGKDYEGLCPFHDDRHLGSFVVSESRNLCSCFSCGVRYNPVDFLMNIQGGHTYREAIEYICQKYGLPIDTEKPTNKMTIKPIILRPMTHAYEELPLLTFAMDLVVRSRKQDVNNLTTWMRSLPWSDDRRFLLDKFIGLYAVGTSTQGRTNGWTAFWYIDDETKVRNCKLMAYKPDGHRDKDINPYTDASGRVKHYNFDFLASMTDREQPRNKGRGLWSSREQRSELCLFGLHLIDAFPDAEVCIVESEKTAIIAQTASPLGKKLFMATGSKSSLTRKQLEPLIKRNRWIMLYPDVDGIDQWREQAKQIGYNRLQVSPRMLELYNPELDDPKADIGDIIVRTLMPHQTTPAQQLHNALGLKEENPSLTKLVETLNLQITI